MLRHEPLSTEVVFTYLPDSGWNDSAGSAISDQQYRCLAGFSESRIQGIIDSEIAIGVERDTIRAMGGGGGGWATEERREHARPSVGSDAIAGGQKQAAPLHTDVAVGAHVRKKVGDPPWAGRVNTAHNVEVDGARNGDTGNRNYADASPEFQVRIILCRGQAGDRQGSSATSRPRNTIRVALRFLLRSLFTPFSLF